MITDLNKPLDEMTHKELLVAAKVLKQDKERFERWSNEAHDKIEELEGMVYERDEAISGFLGERGE